MTDRIGPARTWHARFAWPAALCCVAAMSGAMPAMAKIVFIPRATVSHQTTQQGDWRLTIARDTFSGEFACQLKSRDGRATYRSGGVGFRFYFVKGVADAVYRIDRGDLRTMRDDLPRLVRLNTPIDHGSMADPYDGVVWVPFDQIARARTIAIEPQRGDPVHVFHLGGLAALHDMAVARGCAPESRFVEK